LEKIPNPLPPHDKHAAAERFNSLVDRFVVEIERNTKHRIMMAVHEEGLDSRMVAAAVGKALVMCGYEFFGVAINLSAELALSEAEMSLRRLKEIALNVIARN
jgi:hypothetical protein